MVGRSSSRIWTRCSIRQTQTTKADVLSYYAQVGPTMLPHLRDRPATRKRWPDGVGEVKGKRADRLLQQGSGAPARRIGCRAAPSHTEITTTTTQ